MNVSGRFDGVNEMLRNIALIEKKLMMAARNAAIENALHLLSEAVKKAPIYLGHIGPDGNLLRDKDGKIVKDHVGGKLRASGLVVYEQFELAEGTENGTIRVNTTLNQQTGRLSHKIEVLVGFNTIYAMEQHENLSYRHIDGEAKYLEKPLRENTDRFLRNVQREMIEALRRHNSNNGTT